MLRCHRLNGLDETPVGQERDRAGGGGRRGKKRAGGRGAEVSARRPDCSQTLESPQAVDFASLSAATRRPLDYRACFIQDIHDSK